MYKKTPQDNIFFKYFFFILLSTICISCEKSPSNPTAEKQKPIILTTFTILADLAENIAGERLEVKSITKFGAEIHGYQPTPSDIVKAANADLIIENGLGLDLWSRKFTSSANVPYVTLTKGIEPLLIEGESYSGKPNPHAWMSPARTIIYVENLVSAFSKLDPDGKIYYLKNAKVYKNKLINLDNDLRTILNTIPLSKRVLVSCEGAFSYLARDYGMEEAYLWPVNSESQVTPRRMQKLIDLIKERQIPSIFCESTVSSKPQRQVAKSSGSKFGGTFYVDSLSQENGPAPTLIDLQRHNVRLLQKGLSSQYVKND
tara:strand:+ start:46 stop:993 length:948 start_codon:yes stop_codon:yes gene_type:complete